MDIGWETSSNVTEILDLLQIHPPGQGQLGLGSSHMCLHPFISSRPTASYKVQRVTAAGWPIAACFCVAIELRMIFIFLRGCSKTEEKRCDRDRQSLRYLLFGSERKVCDLVLKFQTQAPAGFSLIFFFVNSSYRLLWNILFSHFHTELCFLLSPSASAWMPRIPETLPHSLLCVYVSFLTLFTHI